MLVFFLELNPQVEQYLEEHMMKCLTQKTTLLKRPVARGKMLRRRMSVKGAIKKTRSIINIERNYFPFLYLYFHFKFSLVCNINE